MILNLVRIKAGEAHPKRLLKFLLPIFIGFLVSIIGQSSMPPVANALYFGTGYNAVVAGNAGGGNQNGVNACATDMVAVGVGLTVNGSSPGFGISCRAIGADGQLVAQDQSSATNTTQVGGGTNKVFCPAGKVVTGVSFIIWSNVAIRCATPPSLSDNSALIWYSATISTPASTNCSANGIVAGFFTRTGAWTDAIGAYCLPYSLNTLSYNVNGGSGTAPSSQTQTAPAQLLTASSAYAGTRAGFHLDGWNAAANGLGTDYATGSSIRPIGATTLYAKWTSTITYNGNTNSGGAVPDPTVAVSSAALTNLAHNSGSLAKTGYYFAGWNTAANGSGTNYPASNPALITETPYMSFDATNFDDTTNAWTDGSGNSRSIPGTAVTNATTGSIRGNPTKVTNTAGTNGASKSFPAVQGTITDGIVLGNGALTNYTLCHVARYAGATRGRLFAGTTGNWLSGFWSGATGVASHEGWITASTGTNDTNWKVQCDTGGSSSLLRSNGVLKSSVANSAVGLPANISINLQGSRSAPGETSDWAVAEVIIYDSVLSTTKIQEIEESLNRKYGVALFTPSIHTYTYASTGDITLYAQWNSTITYDGNGQTSATSTVPAATTARGTAANTTLAAPTTLLLTNFTFDGWNTAANGSGTSYAAGLSTYASTGSTTLYAQWKAPITFNGNTNSEGAAPATVNAITSTITLPSNSGNLTKTGYAFSGWNTAANGSGTTYAAGASYPVTAPATLYANWIADSTGLTPGFNTNTNSAIGVLASTAYVINTAYTNNVNDLVLKDLPDKIQIIASVASGELAITTTTNLTLPTGYQAALNTAAAKISFIGNLADVNAALASLKYTAAATAASGTITVIAAYIGLAGTFRYNTTTPVDYSNLFPALTRTIAIGALATPAAPTLDATSDTGASSTDKKTKDNTPTINVGGLTVGATITLTATPASGTPVTCTFVATNTTGSCTFSTLADDTYSITAKQSLGGTTTIDSTALASVVIDATAPTVTLTSAQVVSGGNLTSTVGIPSVSATITVTFSESVTDLTIAEIIKNAESTGWAITTTSFTTAAITSINFVATNSTGAGGTAGIARFSVGANSAYDVAGNGNRATASDFIINTLIQLSLTNEYQGSPLLSPVVGGNNAFIAQTTAGETLTLPGAGTLTRTGYTFAGWSLVTTNGSGTVVGTTFTPTVPVKLYSSWTPNVYVVTFNANGGNGSPTDATQSYSTGSSALSLTTKGTLARTGYTFAGWNTLTTGLGTNYLEGATYTPTTSIILYAKWTAGTYAVTFNTNTGTGTAMTNLSITAGTTATLTANTYTKTGYAFAGWNTAADGTGNSYANSASVILYGNTTLYAQWTVVAPGAPSVTAATAGNTTAVVTVTGVTASGTTVGPATSFSVQAYLSEGTTVVTGKTCTVLASASPLSCEISGLTNGTTYKFIATAINTAGSKAGLISTVTAIPAPYVVTYAPNGGSVTPTTANYNLGTPIILPLPTRAGFNFTGWFNPSNALIGQNGSNYSPAASITLTAGWAGVSYSITYSSNGSNGGTTPATGAYINGGIAYPIASNTGSLTKTGYTFDGWVDAAGAAKSGNYSTVADIALFAKWNADVFRVTYNINGATTGAAPAYQDYTFGTTGLTLQSSTGFSWTNHIFLGWSKTATGSTVSSPFIPTAATTLYARWAGATYSVAFNSNGGSASPTTMSYTTGGAGITLPSAGTLTGFTFAGWSETLNGTVISGAYSPTVDVTLYAKWTAVPINIRYNKGIIASATPTLSVFPVNTTSTITSLFSLDSTIDTTTVISPTTYAFVGWKDGTTGSIYKAGDSYRVTAADVTFTAQWVAIYTVSYVLNGGTGTVPADITRTDQYSETLTTATVTKIGYDFAGWKDQSNNVIAGPTFTVSSGTYLLYAQWTPITYKVTYAPNGGTGGPSATTDGNYGASVTLDSATLPTYTNFKFVGWKIGSIVYSAGGAYTLTADVTANAQWESTVSQIFYDINGGSGTTPSPSQAIQNVAVTLPTASTGTFFKTGYSLAGWIGGSATTAATTYTNPGTTSLTMIAQWTLLAPAVPLAPTAVAGSGSATITVNPGTNGGPADSYVVTASNGSTCTVYAPSTSCVILGLTDGTSYTFTSTATNSAATSTASPASSAVTPAGKPSVVTGVTATAGNASATVQFAAPATNGGSTITSYTVAASSGQTCTITPTFPNPLACSVTGLTNGTAVTFTVSANNGAFSSDSSTASASITPATVPLAPTGLTATTTTPGAATVTFTASSGTGGSAITGYTITSSPGGFTCTAAASATSCVVTGLTNGTAYTFTAIATNEIGNSVASSATSSVTPQGAPSAPTSVSAAVGDGQSVVTFSGAVANGSTITNYTVKAYDSTGNVVATVTCSTSPCTVTGLTNGSAYTFKVETNATVYGTATASSPSVATNSVTPASAPSAPTGVTATAGTNKITVAWSEPSANGSPISSYTVQAYDSTGTTPVVGATCTATAPSTTCDVSSSLVAGTNYTFKVTATSAAGTSSASTASPSVAMNSAPSVPLSVTATAGNSSATVSWNAPANTNGSAITSYTITAYTAGNVVSGTCTAVAPSETCTVTGLTNGTAYTFEATATNGIGTSAQSTASSAVTPSTVPNAPTALTVASGDGLVTISFTAPTNNGGSPVTGYTVTASNGATISGSSSPLTIAGLTNGTAYTFTVKATNINGDSVASATSASSTPVASSRPTLVNPGQPTGDPNVGSTLTSNVTFNGSPTPVITYQWKVCTDPLDLSTCSNISGATSATFTPTISELGKYIVVAATATNRVGTLTETSVPTLVINPEIAFTAPGSVPAGTVGSAYVLSLAAAGGVGSFGYTVSSGTLPAGLTLNPTTGQISGTPTTAGTYTFTVRATDSNGVYKDVVVTIVVAAAPTTPVVTTPVVTPPTEPPAATCDSACQASRDSAATKAAADKAAADAIAKATAEKAAADAAVAAKKESDIAATTASTKANADAAAAAAAAKAAVDKAAAAAVAQAAADAAAAKAAEDAATAKAAQATAAKAAADAAAALKNSTTTAAAKAAATASANKAAADASAAVRAAATAAQQAAQAKTTAANATKQVDIAINSLNSKTAASQASAQANAIAAAAKAAANDAAAAAATKAAEAKATATTAQKAASDTAARIATEQKQAADAAALAKIAADAAAKATAEKVAAVAAATKASQDLATVLAEKATLAEQAAKATDQTARAEIQKKIDEVSTKVEEVQKTVEAATTKADAAVAAQEEAVETAENATEEAQIQADEAVEVKAESVVKIAAATKATAAATVAAKVATAAKAAAAKVPSKATIVPKASTSTSKNSATATVTGLKPGQKVKVTVNVKPKP